MHSIAREHLQSYLYAYKESGKEQGIGLLSDGRARHSRQLRTEERQALEALRNVINCKVAFAIQTHLCYDGSLEDESPFYPKTVSFKKDDFVHIYQRYNRDWWLGRVVGHHTTIGFVPTARRVIRLLSFEKDPTSGGVWELPRPYTVVPSTRPIVLIGPSSQSCRLTQLMHAAVRYSLVRHFGQRLRRLSTHIGDKTDPGERHLMQQHREEAEGSEREQWVITSLAQQLHLVLLDAPCVDSPSDLQSMSLAPIFIQFRVLHRKILIKLLKKSACKIGPDLQVADLLAAVPADQVGMVIDDNDLDLATRRICNFLEDYWSALHPTTPIMESVYLTRQSYAE